ncbi:hypothetical protein [Duganella guangzhouensis]|nr:hypothetical protein [Duganella guangzhouensis]
MNTGLQLKVVTLLGYVALSSALILMLADDDMQTAAKVLFAYIWFR